MKIRYWLGALGLLALLYACGWLAGDHTPPVQDAAYTEQYLLDHKGE